MAYEIIDHGYMLPDYFQGCGVAYTEYTGSVTGIGDSAKAAYEDAVEMVYQFEPTAKANSLKLPKRPAGFRLRDKVPAHCEDAYWYVSIRYRLED